MNALAKKLCEQIVSEIGMIGKLKEISLSFKDIAVHRDLNALERNNVKKRAALMLMVSLQRTKDRIISDLAVSLGLHKNASVNEILVSGALDSGSKQQLSQMSKSLQDELKELDRINSLVSLMLLTSFKHNRSAIDIFRVHGTIDSTYCKKTKVNAERRQSKVNHKV